MINLGGITLNNMKKAIAIALVSIVTIASTGCSMISKTDQGIKNSPVAKVNGDKITRAQIDEKMKPYIVQIKQSYTSTDQINSAISQQKSTLLDQMILNVLFQQKAKEFNVSVSDADVDKQLKSIKANYKTDAEWKSALSTNGYTEAALKDDIKASLLTSKVVDYLTKNTKITDKQIQDYYNKNQENYTEQKNKIKLSHILVKTEAEAKAVKERIDKGEDFAKVASEVSTDTNSKANGGDLGETEITSLGTTYVAAFANAAKKLKQGEVSEPVKSNYGWHIIKCTSRTNYPVKSLDSVKDDVKKTLLDNAKTAAYKKASTDWKNAAKIKKYENNLND